jgi:transcription elongation factor Elf1
MTCPECGSENVVVEKPVMVDETSVEATAKCKKCGWEDAVTATFDAEGY